MDLSITEIDFLYLCIEKCREHSGGRNKFLKELSNRFLEEKQAKLNELVPKWIEDERIAFRHLGVFNVK